MWYPSSSVFLSPSSRCRIPFTVGAEMSKCLDRTLALAKGYLSRNFLRTGPKIVSGLPGRFSSRQNKSPFLNFRSHHFTVALDRAEPWNVLSSSAVIRLSPHPFRWKCFTTNLCSNSSMTALNVRFVNVQKIPDYFIPKTRKCYSLPQ
jgi:hypothetical protein